METNDTPQGGTFSKLLGGISPLGAALSVGGTIFGAIKGGKANRANEAIIKKQEDQAAANYGLNVSQDYLKSNQAQHVLTQAKNQMNQAQKQAAGRAAITGGSDEMVVAGNSEAQKNYNNILSSVAATGVNYQLQRDQMHQANIEAIQARRMAFNQMKAESAANMVENAGDLFGTLAMINAMKNQDISDSGMGETAQKTTPVFGKKYDPMAFMSAPYRSYGVDASNESPGSGYLLGFDNRNEDYPTS